MKLQSNKKYSCSKLNHDSTHTDLRHSEMHINPSKYLPSSCLLQYTMQQETQVWELTRFLSPAPQGKTLHKRFPFVCVCILKKCQQTEKDRGGHLYLLHLRVCAHTMLQQIKSLFEHKKNETQRKLNNKEMTEMMERYGRGQRDERKEFVYLSLYPRKQGRKGTKLVEERGRKNPSYQHPVGVQEAER